MFMAEILRGSLPCSSGQSGLFVCLVDLVHLVSFVQPKNQTDQTNQMNKKGEVKGVVRDD
jgi:hypothetical protein